ncbi:MAG: cysteine desulfurase family protein [Actinomycetota bacterium]
MSSPNRAAPTEPESPPQIRLLDAATEPLSPVARAAWLAAMDDGWADPRRLYLDARRARTLWDEARQIVADIIGVLPIEVSFPSSGTTARQLGLHGLLHGRRRIGKGLILSRVEHSAFLSTAQWYQRHADRSQPGDKQLIDVDSTGQVDVTTMASAVHQTGTAALCIQAANGEVGTTQPILTVAELARESGVPLLVDYGSVIGRSALPRESDNTAPVGDVLVGDARSWAGPPGVGLLIVRNKVRWRYPGPPAEHEWGRLPEEPNIPQVISAAAALQDAERHRGERSRLAWQLIDELRTALVGLPDVDVVGHPTNRLPHIMTASFLYVDGEALVTELSRLGFAVASGSACTASTVEPSHVLAAMGALTHGNIRITLPLTPVVEDVHALIATLPGVIEKLRADLDFAP